MLHEILNFEFFKTELHFAVETSNIEILKLLLQNKNIDINLPVILHK